MTKNKGAVHLGRLSAKNRRERMGEEVFRETMKAIRAKGKQRSLTD
jgi:hypothetical protein